MSMADTKEKSTLKKVICLLCGVAALLLFKFAPLPESLQTVQGVTISDAGRTALGVLMFCLILWITEPIPFHITGFVGVLLIALLGVDSFANTVRLGFGSDTIVFFIGVLTLSACISRSGLGKRLSMFVLSLTGNKTSLVLLGFLTVGTLLSMWVTDMAVAAMLVPLAAAMLRDEGLEPMKSRFGKALMIACAWGPLVGGIGTPAGAGPNPLAINFIRDMCGIEITFLDWMVYGVPCALLLIVPSWAVLMLFFKPEIKYLSKTKETLRAEFKAMPSMGRTEKATLVIFVITVILWVSSSWLGDAIGVKIPTSLPAILGACLFFLPGVCEIKWKDVQEDISWSSVLLIATGIAIGMSVYNSGAAEWLSRLLLGNLASFGTIARIFFIILVISFLKVGLSSNTVTATVIIPILIAMTQQFNLPVLSILIPASLTLSLAFILVTSTPTSVIPYSAGYFKISDMAKAGTVMTISYCFLMTAALYLIGSLTGIY